ncbi:uncharacterized protein EI97DRAFT_484450 [Westerdykella ornata]|uniref:Uncharacterized protein n=1 Tax=Westerdykella ornata TaxID=318751 RepID=A0A6A6JSE1_WESOR|nr:uncharacterized protein EI97DRAFT_484450 [Westerdykella ornata]KAF2278788.1 hypothetical protein EI97DRAFT_484450 [Westerdykella ornata]
MLPELLGLGLYQRNPRTGRRRGGPEVRPPYQRQSPPVIGLLWKRLGDTEPSASGIITRRIEHSFDLDEIQTSSILYRKATQKLAKGTSSPAVIVSWRHHEPFSIYIHWLRVREFVDGRGYSKYLPDCILLSTKLDDLSFRAEVISKLLDTVIRSGRSLSDWIRYHAGKPLTYFGLDVSLALPYDAQRYILTAMAREVRREDAVRIYSNAHLFPEALLVAIEAERRNSPTYLRPPFRPQRTTLATNPEPTAPRNRRQNGGTLDEDDPWSNGYGYCSPSRAQNTGTTRGTDRRRQERASARSQRELEDDGIRVIPSESAEQAERHSAWSQEEHDDDGIRVIPSENADQTGANSPFPDARRGT